MAVLAALKVCSKKLTVLPFFIYRSYLLVAMALALAVGLAVAVTVIILFTDPSKDRVYNGFSQKYQ